MSSRHEDRMQKIGSVAIPPKGTQARELLEKFLKNEDTPEQRKIIRKLWEKAQAIVAGQQLNGAGNETDQALRWFQLEYNNRIWRHGLHTLPSTANVVEAFLKYAPSLNTFILHQENNHLFSFTDFVNWYASEDIAIDTKRALECFTPGAIYTFDSLNDPAELLYGVEKGSDVGIVGFAMVRFDSEISVMCVAGETEDLKEKSKQLRENVEKCQSVSGREDIKSNPELTVEAVPLQSELPLWRLIALTRFDLNDMSQSVRYVCHDAGTSYLITTDDPTLFLNMEGEFLEKKLEQVAKESAKEIRNYNTLFDLCSTSLFLPLYFEKFDDDIVVERFKTKYADEASKLSFRNIKKNIPHDLKVSYRNVNVLRSLENINDVSATIYSIPNFHIQTSGYWRTLAPGKIGTDKKGEPIHGRTWVSKKLTWMEAEEPSVLVAKRKPQKILPDGPAPGFVYVMKSPLQPINVFKVGITQRTTQERADELSRSTGVPGKIYVMHEWAVGDCVTIEREVHNRLSEYRVDPRREFFETPLEHIISVIDETIHSMK